MSHPLGFFLALLLAKIAKERLKILTSLLIDLQTSVRGQNGVEFDQESSGHGPRHVTHLNALLLAKLANERLKILTLVVLSLGHQNILHIFILRLLINFSN